MIRQKFFFILILTVAAVATVFANNPPSSEWQQRLRGQVVDEKAQPLPGVSVWVEGTTIGASTNAKGVFEIRMPRAEKCLLNFSFVGYKPISRVIDPADYNGPELRVTMLPAVNELDEVVVTGSRMERPLKEVPVLTRIISAKDIQTLNPMSMENLLQYAVPGLQIGYNSMSQQPTIKYQGVGGAYVLFLIDGERVGGEGSDHNVDFSRFNVDDIERIEVVKGSQSTAYGSNALGGVINIITKQANRPITANLGLRYGANDGGKYTLSGGLKRNRWSAYTSITHRHRKSFTIGDEKGENVLVVDPAGGKESMETELPMETRINGYRIWNATQKVGLTISDKVQADIKGSWYRNDQDIRPEKKHRDIFTDYTMGAKLTMLTGEESKWTLSYLYDHYKKDKFFVVTQKNRTDFRNRLQDLRSDYTTMWHQHKIGAGVSYLHEYLKHYMLKDSADAKMSTCAVYLQDEWGVTERLSLIAGLRADYHSRYKWHLTPKLSLMYKPTAELTFRGGYAQGFRSPSLKELYQAYDMGGLGWFMLYGNENLKPETSHQWALSGEWTKGGLNCSLSGYFNRFHNKIAYQPLNNGTADLQYVNAENARTLGVESMIRYQMGNGLTLSGAYAYVNDYQEMEGRNTSTSRPHSITFGGLYAHYFGQIKGGVALNGHWESALNTYVYTRDKLFKKYHYEPRLICSLNLSAQFPRGFNLMLGVDNLFNHRDKAANSSIQLPQQGISLVGTLNLNIGDLMGW